VNYAHLMNVGKSGTDLKKKTPDPTLVQLTFLGLYDALHLAVAF
jgi:hypothetical protein